MKAFMQVLMLSLYGLIQCQNIGVIAELPSELEKPSSSPCCPTGIMYLDLNEGQYCNHLPGVTDFHLIPQPSGQHCSHMVDFKVTFELLPSGTCIGDWKCGKRLLKIKLEIDDNHGGFLFNIGDSSTNNGFGGDSNTQQNDAEIMGKDDDIIIYYSDHCPGQNEQLPDSLDGARYVTLWIGNEFTRIQTRNSADVILQTVSYCNSCLFALNNQDDDNINLDIYVALNNVILRTFRRGFGVCKAWLNWECCDSFNE